MRTRIRDAGDALRKNDLPRLESWIEQCGKCDLAELCRKVPMDARQTVAPHLGVATLTCRGPGKAVPNVLADCQSERCG